GDRDRGDREEVGVRREAELRLPLARAEEHDEPEHDRHEREHGRELLARDRDVPQALRDRRLVTDDRCRGAHAATSFAGSPALRRGAEPGLGRRKIARTSGGAAMNRTMSDWMTVTISIGIPSAACIVAPPARNAPNRIAAPSTPTGFERPSSATVIASKPIPASTSVEKPVVEVPSTCVTPASATSAPETTMTHTVVRPTSMPATRAARGFSPTARKVKPSFERSMSHQVAATARSASTK